jgi:anti-sigma B factor antagonist
MKLSYEDHGSVTVLTLSGELMIDQADAFRRICQDRFTAGVHDVVIDMSHLTLMDSAGLELLLWLAEETTDHRGQLRLVNPDSTIAQILNVTRLDRRFNIHPTVESAAKSLR